MHSSFHGPEGLSYPHHSLHLPVALPVASRWPVDCRQNDDDIECASEQEIIRSLELQRDKDLHRTWLGTEGYQSLTMSEERTPVKIKKNKWAAGTFGMVPDFVARTWTYGDSDELEDKDGRLEDKDFDRIVDEQAKVEEDLHAGAGDFGRQEVLRCTTVDRSLRSNHRNPSPSANQQPFSSSHLEKDLGIETLEKVNSAVDRARTGCQTHLGASASLSAAVPKSRILEEWEFEMASALLGVGSRM
ncbi:hypothetical protein DL93DRAFT_2090454 [Clavulina sp. PMI_390]|nr:hypothetical protein DL93DRAFT_2090454 [Clavulina sp. PMI_390]